MEIEMDEPDEIERAWLVEARQRLERLQRGETELLSLEKVDARVRALFLRDEFDYFCKRQHGQIGKAD